MSQSFTRLLEERNLAAIDLFSSESALGFQRQNLHPKDEPGADRTCVLMSFDPPVGYPPVVFDWRERDVWYLPKPELNKDGFEALDERLKNSRYPAIVVFEREKPPHLRKIKRFIRSYLRRMPKENREASELEVYLAEYRGPFARIQLRRLEVSE